MYFAPFIDASGVHIPTYSERLEAMVSAYRHIFGSEANLEISSPDYQLLAMFARALDDLSQIILADFASRNPQYASGAALDLLLPLHGLSRGGATYSRVNLSLTGTPGAVLPVAPQVLDDAGHIWVCPSAGIQMNEDGSALVTATCTTPGAISAPAGTVRRLVSPVSGLTSAVNPAPAIPGTETETDASCRNRLRAAAAGPSLGTLDALRQAVLSVTGVTACEVLENTSEETDSRGIPPHSICVLFAGGNANDVAQMVFDKKAPGIGTYGAIARPVTDAWGGAHTVNLQRIAGASVAVTLELSPMAGYDSATVPDAIRTALADYSATLGPGQPLVVSSLYPVIYAAVPSSVTLFSIRLLSVTYGGTTTFDTLTVPWNQKVQIRAAQVAIIESDS